MTTIIIKYKNSPVELEAWLESNGCVVANGHYQIEVLIVHNRSTRDTASIVEELRDRTDVVSARMDGPSSIVPLAYDSGDPAAYRNEVIWNAMRIAEAHQITKGLESVVIGVMGTGVDTSHPDLAGALVPGLIFQDGLDRRQGQYPFAVDLAALFGVSGSMVGYSVEVYRELFNFPLGDPLVISSQVFWDEAMSQPVLFNTKIKGDDGVIRDAAIMNTAQPVIWIAEEVDIVIGVPPSGTSTSFRRAGTYGVGLTAMEDHHGHETGVTGIIVAQPDNGTGFEGIAPRCKVMPIKITDNIGRYYSSAIISAFMYVGNNLKAVNCSFGGPGLDPEEEAAVQFAASRALIVAATGNSSNLYPFTPMTRYDSVMYPAAFPSVFAVSGTSARNNYHWVAQFAQRYAEVDICAPATNWGLSAPTYNAYQYWDIFPDGVAVPASAGTSFSSPAVIAIMAGLMYSAALANGYDDSTIDTRMALINQIKERTREAASTIPVTTYDGTPAIGVGAGAIDAARAVKAIVNKTDIIVGAPEKAVLGVPASVRVDARTWSGGLSMLEVYEGATLIHSAPLSGSVYNTPYSYIPTQTGSVNILFRLTDAAGAANERETTIEVVSLDSPTLSVLKLYDFIDNLRMSQTTAETTFDRYATYTTGWSLPVIHTDNIFRVDVGSISGQPLEINTIEVYIDGAFNTVKNTGIVLGRNTVTIDPATITHGLHSLRVVATAANGAASEQTTDFVYAPADKNITLAKPLLIRDGYLEFITYFMGQVEWIDAGDMYNGIKVDRFEIYFDDVLAYDTGISGAFELFYHKYIKVPEGVSASPEIRAVFNMTGFRSDNDVYYNSWSEGTLVLTGTAALEGMIAAPSVQLLPTVAAPSLVGSALSTGSISAAPVSLCPTVAAPSVQGALVGAVGAASVSLRPSVSPATLSGVQVGSMTVPAVTLRPSVAVGTLSGVESFSVGSIAAASTTMQIQVNPPTLRGVTAGTAIRAPDGSVWDLRDIYGVPLDIRAVA